MLFFGLVKNIKNCYSWKKDILTQTKKTTGKIRHKKFLSFFCKIMNQLHSFFIHFFRKEAFTVEFIHISARADDE